MNKQILKIIRDKMPEPLKLLSAKIIRNKLIKNKDFCKYFQLLEEREKLSCGEIEGYQFMQLKNILVHSYQNVPYYQKLFDEISFNPHKFSDFEQIKVIPFLTREIIQENYETLISSRKVKRAYYTGRTSGSTGFALKFLLDYDSIFKENAFIYYYRKKLDYNFKDKLATFRAIKQGNLMWEFKPMYNEFIFSPIKLSKDTINDYAVKIKQYNPQYLNGYISAIWYFAKLLNEYQIKIPTKLKGIFFVSENIDSKQREFVEQFFNVKSSTFYGHSERCVIAEEILPGKYQFDPYYGYTEQIPAGNNEEIIVGTGFLNYVMPLIRYKTDDFCVREGQYFSIEGKRCSNIGLFGTNYDFLPITAIYLLGQIFKNVMRFQFIQNEKGVADLLLVVNKYFQTSELEMIKDDINRQTRGIIKVNIKLVDSLILSPSGKYMICINNLKGEF